MELPYLIFCDKAGKIYHHPSLKMVASSFNLLVLPLKEELIKLPSRNQLFFLPGRYPVGFDPKNKDFVVLKEFKGKEVFALSVHPEPAYLRLYNPATVVKEKKILPLWAYTACGFYKGSFYITAQRVDKRIRQSPRFYNNNLIKKSVTYFLHRYPKNRLYKHLTHCALNYNCLAAKNLFLQRWEAPLPTSRFCNANCIGCLSYQKDICSSHQRISFKPTVAEIAEVMINHLKVAKEAIVSFGQGCEGEPLLEAELISESIREVRKKVKRGTININTNASLPDKIALLCQAGVDSFRVSLNSPDPKIYNLYFKPKRYKFYDVIKSIAIAKEHGKFVSVNLFVFPGLTDSKEQIELLIEFVKKTKIDMIQWRNLSIDHDYYINKLSSLKPNPQGLRSLLQVIAKKFPNLKTGYFNLFLKNN
ncbi:MAG: radical SAM protein [Candidatus Omnitrophica bacterium]|jgi:pyruvate-formate lyase-activating enzyme|nr:radical SAM protein [Candidatus Omnitrophota bacterium]